MLVAEVTGALDSSVHALLGRLHARSRVTGHRDGTVYGSSRSATRSFYTHHVRMHAVPGHRSLSRWARALRTTAARPRAASRVTCLGLWVRDEGRTCCRTGGESPDDPSRATRCGDGLLVSVTLFLSNTHTR